MNQLAVQPIDLASEPDFSLGVLRVSPSGCRLRANGGERRVQPRVMETLIVLARAGGRTVSRDELIETCWGGRFVSDDAVNRVIGEVRNLARGVEPAPFVLETVSKVGYRLIAADVAGSDDDAAPGPSPARPAARRDWRRRGVLAAALALVVAIAGGLAVWRFGVGQQPPPWQNGRVEVMRFEPLQQGDPALRRYSVALADAIIRMLTNNGVETSARPVGRDDGGRRGDAELRVAGTVDRDGPRYVVNAQVLDRRSGDILWSGRFDRDAAAPVGFQEEAANRIADGLDCALWHRAADRKPMTARVFAMFLNACVTRRGIQGDSRPYLEITSRLVRAAPDHSYAHSLHAVALAMVATDSHTSPSEAETLSRAVEAASQRALQLDRRNGEAFLALGARYHRRGQWLEREQNFERAAELSPTLRVARSRYVGLLLEVGRWEDAVTMNRRTIVEDPFSSAQLGMLALRRAAAGDLVEAEALTRRLDLLDLGAARGVRYSIALFWEDPREAFASLPKYALQPAGRELACHRAYLRRLTEARGAVLRGLPSQCDGVGDYRVRMLARQGDVDGAYAAFAANPSNYRFPVLFFYPEMKAFRRDVRFMPLAHRVGLVDYWMKSGHWPDFCAEPDLPYDCKAVARKLAGVSPAAAR